MMPMRTTSVALDQREAPTPVAETRRSIRLTKVQTLIVVASMLVTAAIAAALALTNPPIFETSRSILVLSGANPNDNEVLTRALESLLTSKGLAAEVKRRGDLPQSIDQISAMINASRKPESAFMDVVVSNPDKAVSEQVSAQVIPALSGVFESAQQDLPVESRITGPIFQEVFARPLQSTSTFPLWFALGCYSVALFRSYSLSYAIFDSQLLSHLRT